MKLEISKVKYTIWAADRLRATEFYKNVFGAVIERENPHVTDLNIMGAIISIHNGGAGKRTWTGITFSTNDVVLGSKKVIAAGGKCEREPQEENGESPHLAMCEDTEGNQIMLSRPRS